MLEETEKSQNYLSSFADLLRMLLDNANHPFIPLRKELDFLELYLSLENLRITNLEYAINITPDIKTNEVKIPNMILQPYIENAIWHGLSQKQNNRKLEVNICQQGDNILIDITDNGIGRKKAAELKSLYRKQHRSRGMELLSDRFSLLSQEYGTEIKTTITDLYENQISAGTRVEIIVPCSLSEKIVMSLS
jgi:LytS/YehU family sensor histidine kinase